ncbi:hypothetical protein Poli38472_004766 [Pythium oligandrum]|uniref:Uncharacterized protein n=1 Tax=Pythium oligandrum TaxID=41045 RepID=A0A8K1CC89_PYTOL|nr:hypothetical protein Poli38472_004766 [Pythium oligandrum]|eukprot:TMW59697.1 hypothetical protein Poli38472_004766 [Pythium oligandrum]
MTRISYRQRSGSSVSGVWTATEHELFLEGMALYPRGPWRAIADHIGTRSLKQVQTHAQKYQQKLLRYQRGLRKNKIQPRLEHRVDGTTIGLFTSGAIMRKDSSSGGEQTSILPQVLKRIEPVPFNQPPESMDWNINEVQLLMETLDVALY